MSLKMDQNRVATGLPKLPEEFRRLGVTTTRRSTYLTVAVYLVMADESRELFY